ncbi:winged helix-turn-helix domain-containing protein [Pseudorhodoferax sp. LjRoot39]|uniref:ATP-binding protein n=1 Tax=Pseudorhodoferax sp. LjRoot39 TaxID=3342328 RepID=UPI003ECEFC65
MEEFRAVNDLVYTFGPFQLLPRRRLLLRGGVPQRLGGRALDVLLVLVRRAGEVLGQDELTAAVWPRAVVAENNLRVHIAAVRKVLGDTAADARYIVSIPLRGYAFVAPVQSLSAPADNGPAPAPAEDPLRSRLPAPLAALIGRDTLIDELLQALATQRFITLVGPGGIGKTSVALAVAHRLRARDAEPPCFVDLAAVADARGVAGAFAAPLGLAVPAGTRYSGLAAQLQGRRLLVVLDNCEHLLDAAAELAEALCRGAPQLQLLATSREALRAEGEQVVRLPALALPDPQAPLPADAEAALRYPAIALFAERAAAGQDGFRLQTAHIAQVAQICRSLDGIPLAIELAAAHVHAFGVQQLAEHLQDSLALLTQGRRTAAPRQHTLRAAMDWSYELLAAPEQALLRRLSVFQGFFTLHAALAVADPAELPGASDRGALLESLSQLVAKSLVMADPAGETMRYRLLETTRAYTQEKLLASGECERLNRRHADHCLARAGQVRVACASQHPQAWLREHGEDLNDLRAALLWAFSAEGDAATGAALAAESAPLWYALSLMHEYLEWVELALSRARQLEPVLEMRLLDAQGHTLWHARGVVTGMRAAFERLQALAERHDVAEARRAALWGLWLHANMDGENARSLQFAQRFAASGEDVAPAAFAPVAARMLALSNQLVGRLEQAQRGCEQVLTGMADSTPTVRRDLQFDPRVSARGTLARTLWLRGRSDEARAMADETVALAEGIGHDLSLIYALAMAALPVALWTGELALAARHNDALQARASMRSLKLWQMHGEGYARVLARRRGLDTGTALPAALRQLAGRHLQHMLATQDEALADDALLARLDGEPAHWSTAELLRIRAMRLQHAGHGAQAEALLRQALALATQQGAVAWQLRCASSLAQLLHGGPLAAAGRDGLAALLASLPQGQDTPDRRRAAAILATAA